MHTRLFVVVLVSCAIPGSLAKEPCTKLPSEAVVGSAVYGEDGKLTYADGMPDGESVTARRASRQNVTVAAVKDSHIAVAPPSL